MRLSKQVLAAVQSVIGTERHALHVPDITRDSFTMVDEVLERGHLSAGMVVDTFESKLCAFLGAKYAVATCSGTTALHAAYSILFAGIKTEIHIPSLTFVATANALAQCGHKIRFVDFGNPAKDVHVDLLGHPATLGGTIHDSAQALGSKRSDGRYVGSTGTSVFSFNQNKIITTGGGGAIVTEDPALYKALKHLTTTARIPHSWQVAHDQAAFNYRMPDLNAAVGVGQLLALPDILAAKRALAARYIEAFKGMSGVRVWEESPGTVSNYWLVALRFDTHDAQQMALWDMHNAGIQVRMLPKPLHLLPMYADCRRDDMSETMDLYRTVICLPSSPKLGFKYVG